MVGETERGTFHLRPTCCLSPAAAVVTHTHTHPHTHTPTPTHTHTHTHTQTHTHPCPPTAAMSAVVSKHPSKSLVVSHTLADRPTRTHHTNNDTFTHNIDTLTHRLSLSNTHTHT